MSRSRCYGWVYHLRDSVPTMRLDGLDLCRASIKSIPPRWLACVLHPVSGVSHAACLDRATSAAYGGYEVSSFDISGGNIRAGPSVG